VLEIANAQTLCLKMEMTGGIGLLMTKGISWRVELDMTIEVSTPLASALTYLNMGLSVFPLASREKKPPKQFTWEPFQHMLPTQEQLKAWFDGTDNNIAVVTGAVSTLLAFDIDGSLAKFHADDVIRNRIRQDTKDAISDTLWVETGGGGLHIIIRYNPQEFQEDNSMANEIKNSVLWRDKDEHSEIRLKGDGGYIVAVPSVHPNGNSYRFLKGTSIAVLSKEQILDLIQAFSSIGRNHYRITQKKADNKHTVRLVLRDFCRQ
jgi:hypothetical protein